jgi:hypothetical protein
MKHISEMMRMDQVDEVRRSFRDTIGEMPVQEQMQQHAVDLMISNVLGDLGDSPEAVRGACVVIHFFTEIMRQVDEYELMDMDWDALIAGFGITFFTQPAVFEASEILDGIHKGEQ